jgi:hypothetical protein
MRTLINISHWFGRIPSIGYAFIYLLLIPIFATIYYEFLPEDFYHSTVQYEGSIKADAENILHDVRTEIIENFKTVHGADEADVNGWKVNINQISLRFLNISDNDVYFLMNFTLSKVEEIKEDLGDHVKITTKSTSDEINPTIRIGLIYTIVQPTMGDATTEYKFPRFIDRSNLGPFNTEEGEANLEKFLFPYNYEGMSPFVPVLPIPRELNDRLLGYSRGLKGFPSGISGSYVRMFYLSSVTITTVGYGDIIPITTAARILVSIEAILGVVVIGLFLNSLGHVREQSVDSHPKKVRRKHK